jgi:hypothetical protein
VSTDEWCTPKWLADELGWFALDPCSNANGHIKASSHRMLSAGDDGLGELWAGSVFCNPPYSNVGPWTAKLSVHPDPWVALVKLDPTTKWWATLMSADPVVAPFRHRIKFEGEKSMTANFPSVLVYRNWTPPPGLRPYLWLRGWV